MSHCVPGSPSPRSRPWASRSTTLSSPLVDPQGRGRPCRRWPSTCRWSFRVPGRTRRTYNSYWTLLVEMVGGKALDAVTVEDLIAVADEGATRERSRRRGSDGRASSESCVAASRAVFGRALKAGHLARNPALLVDKPRRLPNRRRALSDGELAEVWAGVGATTKDPALDLLLLRFHLETGARHGRDQPSPSRRRKPGRRLAP